MGWERPFYHPFYSQSEHGLQCEGKSQPVLRLLPPQTQPLSKVLCEEPDNGPDPVVTCAVIKAGF